MDGKISRVKDSNAVSNKLGTPAEQILSVTNLFQRLLA